MFAVLSGQAKGSVGKQEAEGAQGSVRFRARNRHGCYDVEVKNSCFIDNCVLRD